MATAQQTIRKQFVDGDTIRDYCSFLGYSAVPALAPLLVVSSLHGQSLRSVVDGGMFYLVVIGASGTLISKAIVAGRRDDREQVHLPIFVVLLLACIGFGLSVALQSEGVLADEALADFRTRSAGFSVGLFALTLGPVGLNTCRITSRAMKRGLDDHPRQRVSDGNVDAISNGPIDLDDHVPSEQAEADATLSAT